ncbi:hypothetical protein MVEN_00470400 [Mycena venus]|uniref:Protein kinase domain-containing protein n=1 Tax=Mycena venus TaxID=2733690 RepID=A0A8H7D958_9AGAR|nr:hypothetical protein MVEN_00470400 [Mycena venus]
MNEDSRSTSTSTVTVGVSAPYTGAFFPRSRNLAIAGGMFTSNVTNIYNCPPAVPCDFRRIPLGDLDLRHEIRFEWDSDTAYRRHYGGSARKFYSARIHGCNTNLTAAVYQGETAEEYLRDTVLKYSWLRHPNIVQLFGIVNTSGIHAVIYHDDLVPAKQILEHYRRSHLRTVLFWRYMDAEFKDARDHLQAILHWTPNSWDCTIWIRSSTGRVAIELIPSSHELNIFQRERSGFLLSPMEPHPDSEIIASLSISDYHLICSHHLRKDRIFSLSTHSLIAPGAIYWCPRGSSFDDAIAIACFPGGDISGWHNSRPGAGHPLVPGINGWTRLNSCDAVGRHLKCLIMSRSFDNRTWWCAQANHIFDRLGSISDYEDPRG